MPKKLVENISSGYFEAANRLTPKAQRERIVAYVESYDDVFFWRIVLKGFENEQRYFEIMLPDKFEKLERGKKAAMMQMLKMGTGRGMIACVDADYDYLLQGVTPSSATMLGSPYIFHTFAYAIENLLCYAPSLRDVCVAATLNDAEMFDMERYLTLYSQAIYPLFVWNIWHYRRKLHGEFTIAQLLKIIEPSTFRLQEPELLVENVRRKVARQVRLLQAEHPDAKASYLQLKDELRELGVTPANCYLYIKGHHLFDRVVMPMLKRVCDHLIRLRQNEIGRQSVNSTQRHNELQCYNRSITSAEGVLRKNVGFVRSPQFRQIIDRIAKVFPLSETKSLLSGKNIYCCPLKLFWVEIKLG